jgi:mono/diheme cytochrome c family protein
VKIGNEDYSRYLWVGLALTLLIIGLLSGYWLGEASRLARAAEDFTARRIDRGRAIYAVQCVACHGKNGEGTGAPALNNRTVLKNTLDDVFFSVIRSGVPSTEMPAWSVDYGGPLTDEDIHDVVAFIRAWEPTAPEIEPTVVEPDPARGALLFATTCAICHGDNGRDGSVGPDINDPARLQSLPDDWYRATIRSGRPARGMPTWGSVLSPQQIEDLIALLQAWRSGQSVAAAFAVPDLLNAAVVALQAGDTASARLQLQRAINNTDESSAEVIGGIIAQLDAGEPNALPALKALQAEWPIGDAATGAAVYSGHCLPCHGSQGEGGIGTALRDNPFIQANANAELLQFIQTGRPGTAMSGFDDHLTDIEVADVIAFLRLWQNQQ